MFSVKLDNRPLMACLALSLVSFVYRCHAQDAALSPDYERYLQLFELGATADLFQDGSAISAEERPVLERCIECASRMPSHLATQWQQYGPDYDAIAAATAAARFRLISLRGRLRALERVESDLTQSSPGEALYKATLDLSPGMPGASALVAELFVPRIPKPWLALVEEHRDWDERVSATAIVFKRTAANRLVLIARRLAWHPDRARDEPVVDPHHVWLAQYGMDIGALYDVTDVGKLAAQDAPAFYGLLAAMNRTSAVDIEAADPIEDNVVELLQNLPTHRGKLYRLSGTARRIIKILVDDPAQRSLYGVDHYYEVVLFADPDAIVRVRGAGEDQERVFATYPVVFCCTSLPPSCPEGEKVQETIEITGVYLKTWQYPSQFMSSLQVAKGRALQPSPLLIGKSPQLLVKPQPESRLGMWVGLGFIGVLLSLTLILWRVSAADREISRRRRVAGAQAPDDY